MPKATKREAKEEVIPGFAERLRLVINTQCNGTSARLAQRMGDEAKYRNRVSAWLRGAGITGTPLLLISKATGVSLHYLLTGEGPPWSADLISRKDAVDAVKAAKANLERHFANRVSALLENEGIGSEDLVIDSGTLLDHTAHLVADQIRSQLDHIQNAETVADHAYALRKLIEYFSGVDDESELLLEKRTAKIAQYLPDQLKSRYESIIRHATISRVSDITQHAFAQVEQLYPGVSLSGSFQPRGRRYPAQHAELNALQTLTADHKADRPLMSWKSSGAAFTKTPRQPKVKVAKAAPSPTKPPTKRKTTRRK